MWLASVRDAFSRRVVGWKASDRADTELVLGALEYALWSRQVERERLVFHSDHGEQAELDLVRWIDGWYNPAASNASLAG